MTTEISNDVTVETVSAPSKPTRNFVQASQDRIDYHVNVSFEKMARLTELETAGKTGSKAHARCLASLAKNEEFIASLKASLQARLEKSQAESVVVEPATTVAA